MPLSGCTWESTLYNQFVGADGHIVSCVGYCDTRDVDIDREKCTGDGLTWIEAHCLNPLNGTILQGIETSATCEGSDHEWQNAHCEVTSEFGCYKVRGTWIPYQYDMLDLGNGEYIREVTRGYACGKYADVIQATKATVCPPEAVSLFEASQQNKICPNTAPNCLSYSPEIHDDVHTETAQTRAMCSSCAEGMAICYENNKFQCVDLNTSVNHCGICGNKCDANETCIDSQCIAKPECLDLKCNDINQTCVHPSANETCGATCDNPDGERCDQSKGLSCTTISEGVYACTCASGILNPSGYCVNPAANETCNATKANPEGKPCPSGLACRPTSDNKAYECVCAKSWEVTCHDATSDYCVDPTSEHEHCGAPRDLACQPAPDYQCGPSQKCVNSNCECLPEFAACGNRCIDSSLDPDYCGAKGKCNQADPGSADWQGKSCGAHAYCSKSQCLCEAGYIMCQDHCISPASDQFCGASQEGAQCRLGTDCTAENRKSCQNINGTYKCVCDSGYIECGGKCIDPTTNSQFCGKLNSDPKHTTQCSELTACNKQACVDGVCKDNCPDDQISCPISETESICVKQSIYQLKVVPGNCTICADGYCPDPQYTDDFFHEDRCLKKNDSNKLNTDNHCSKCNDACTGGKTCQITGSSHACACPADMTLCQGQCLDLKALHKATCNTCETGWDDCNKDPSDGCEANILDNKEHCGKCSNNCEQNLANKHVSNIVCISESCQFTTCHTGYGNCDGKSSNGCETQLLTSASNCGSCGYKCGQNHACSNSKCCLNSGHDASAHTFCCNKKYGKGCNKHGKNCDKYRCANQKPNGQDWIAVSNP